MNITFVLENIKQKRKALGLTQKEVALRLFMDERTYSKIERGGKKSIDINFIFSLAEILQTDITELLRPPANFSNIPTDDNKHLLDDIVALLNQVSDQQQHLSAKLQLIKEQLQAGAPDQTPKEKN